MATKSKSTAHKAPAKHAADPPVVKQDGIDIDEATRMSLQNAASAASTAQPTIPDGPPNAPVATPPDAPITSAGIEAANGGTSGD